MTSFLHQKDSSAWHGMENMRISNICSVNSLPLKSHTLICFLTYLRIAYSLNHLPLGHIFLWGLCMYIINFFPINLLYVNLFIRSDKELRRVEEIFFFSLLQYHFSCWSLWIRLLFFWNRILIKFFTYLLTILYGIVIVHKEVISMVSISSS